MMWYMVGVRTCFSSAKASGKFKNHHLIVIIWHLKSSDFFLTLPKTSCENHDCIPMLLHIDRKIVHFMIWPEIEPFSQFSDENWLLGQMIWAHCVPTNFRLQIKNLTWIFSSKLAKYCTVINFTLYKIFQLYNFCLLWCTDVSISI